MRKLFSSAVATLAIGIFATGCAGPEEKLGRGINNVTELARGGEIRRSIVVSPDIDIRAPDGAGDNKESQPGPPAMQHALTPYSSHRFIGMSADLTGLRRRKVTVKTNRYQSL